MITIISDPEYLRSLIDISGALPSGIVLLSAIPETGAFRVEFVNPAARIMLGGRTVDTHPAISGSMAKTAAAEAAAGSNAEFVFEAPPGTRLRIRASGSGGFIVLALQDESAAVAAEAEMAACFKTAAALLDFMPFPSAIASSAMTVLHSNHAASRLGFFPGASIRRSLCTAPNRNGNHAKASGNCAVCLMNVDLSSGKMYSSAEIELAGRKWRAEAVTIIDGRFFFCLRDTSASEAERISFETFMRHEEFLRSRAELAASLCRNLRTPLNNILGFTGLLNNTELTPEQKEFAEFIKSGGKDILSFINDMLDYARVRNGSFAMECEEFEPAAIASEAAGIRRLDSGTAIFRVKVHEPAVLEARVIGDPCMLRRVLMAVCKRAELNRYGDCVETIIENVFSSAAGITLKFTVSGCLESAGRGDWKSRGDHAARHWPDPDLDMALAEEFVKLMGGEGINFMPDGPGHAFSFNLYFNRGRILSRGGAAATAPAEAKAAGRQLKILLAEDNHINAELVRRALTRYGHGVATACDGPETISLFDREKFDVILMDIQMPGMSGIDAAKVIRTIDKEIPIIAITTSVAPEDKDACTAAGMNEYIQKPVEIEELQRILLSLTGNGSAGALKPGTTLPGNGNIPACPAFDLDKLTRNMAGIKELMVDAVSMFIEFFSGYMKDLVDAHTARDAKKLKFFAHKLKGTSMNACAPRVAATLIEIEKASLEERFGDAEKLIEMTSSEFEKYKEEVRSSGFTEAP